ncbi:MAG: septum formation initiator family protein [Candidatus Gracilibacteria bacterium]
MSSRFSHNSVLTKTIIIVEFFLVAYLLYSLTKNVYNSYLVDKHIEQFQAENAKIENENRQKTEDYLYFTSEEYIDKIAKQNLGLVNPGEEVIVLSEVPAVANEDGEEEGDSSDFARYYQMSKPKQWLNFFFE